MDNKCKVLSPVGSMDVLKAAVFSGADYVYLSGKMYGARDYASNFTHKELEEAIEFCHNFNVGVFVTVNTSILESEIVDVVDYVYFLYTQGVDAVIVEDIGLASIIDKLMPNLDLHASTQMTIYDYSMVKYLADNGFVNANISREVPLSRIKSIIQKLDRYDHDIKIEVFVHGALCYSYSGRCLMSSFLGGRSGNRGLCAQPCRMRYALLDKYHGKVCDDKYMLSTKDLCTIDDVSRLIDCGVDCLKIEGRMKSEEYVSSTTYAYKNAVNECNSREDKFLLNLAFNRSLTGGYMMGNDASEVVGRSQPGSNGYPIGVVSKSNSKKITVKLLNKDYPIRFSNGDGLKFEFENKSYGMYITRIFDQSKYKLIIANDKNIFLNEGTLVYITYSKYLHDKTKSIINEMHVNKIPLELEVNVNDNRQLEVKCMPDNTKKFLEYVSDERFEKAQKRPLSKESVSKQLSKTGQSKFTVKDITYKNFPDDLFMPISTLNDIRRHLLKDLKKELDKLYTPDKNEIIRVKKDIDNFKKKHYSNIQELKSSRGVKTDKTWNVYIQNLRQAELIKDYTYIDCVYYDGSYNHENMHDYIRAIYDELYHLSELLPEDTGLVWVLPQLLLDEDFPHISEILLKLEVNDIDVKLQTDSIGAADNMDASFYGNYLNVYNNYSIEKLSEDKLFERLVISNEISIDDIRRLHSDGCELEYVIFGYNQLMISRDDFEDVITERISNYYYLKDKRDNEYPLVFDCNGNSHIYDYRIANLAGKLGMLEDTGIHAMSIDLRHLNINDSRKVLDYFENIIANDYHVSDDEKLTLTDNNQFYELNIEKGLFVNRKK
ncbi:MAG: U32 family peptidase [Methanosphaera sp.]|nr:U32 family peptidase [Methanosphaera sp.]